MSEPNRVVPKRLPPGRQAGGPPWMSMGMPAEKSLNFWPSAKRMLVIADETKLVARLGKFPLPVEVVMFGRGATVKLIEAAVAKLGYANVPVNARQRDGELVRTDSGNLIYDCAFGAIKDTKALAAALSAVPGVVEHGLFIGIATTLVIAHPGEVEVIPASR